MVEDDEVFEALCSSLPAPIRREFHQSGEAFKEGYIALNQGRFEVAGEKLLQAMNENPEAEFIALELAAAYLNLERHEEARGLVEGFLGSHPDSLQGYQVLCETLWAMEEFEAALERLKGCPVTLAESVPLIILRGETLMHAGRLEEAEQLYENELGSRGWQSDIARSLGGCYEARGKIEQARDIFGKLLTECRTCGSASDPYVKQRFSELSFELGDYSSSVLEHYLSLVREDPSGRADYYEKISRIYALQGNDEEAERFEGFAQRARRDLLASETGP
jgi:tetratricopeptide (TPR) repeat protein